jgi:ethanolamine ammonia-lyase large subunit
VAREAIHAELDLPPVEGVTLRRLRTAAMTKDAHLNDPELGTRLDEEIRRHLSPEHVDVQIVISDGLSADAIHHNVPDMLPVLMDGLRARDLRIGQPIVAPLGRVKLAESVADTLESRLVIMLIGERPGGDALASRSMSAYMAYRIGDEDVRELAVRFSGNPDIRYEYTVVSNIYAGGLPPLEAGSVVAEKAARILTLRAAGNRLESLLQQT